MPSLFECPLRYGDVLYGTFQVSKSVAPSNSQCTETKGRLAENRRSNLVVILLCQSISTGVLIVLIQALCRDLTLPANLAQNTRLIR
jgi:hypothetical protein